MKIFKKVGRVFKTIGHAWSASKAATYGAAVAYYTIFSIAPLLVIAITVAGLFVDKHAAQDSIIAQFSSTLGHDSAVFIQGLLDYNLPKGSSIVLTIVGILAVLLGATGIFNQLQSALDTIFDHLPEKKTKGLVGKILKNLLSISMVLSVGFLLIASLVFSSFITFLANNLSNYLPDTALIARGADFLVSVLLISTFLMLMYKFLPTKILPWKAAVAGGLLGGVLFTIGKFLLGLYLGSSSAATGYGVATALVLLVIWTYYMSQIFFMSAIIVRLYIAHKK